MAVRSFGADDDPPCEKCGSPTSLSRRSPAPGNQDHESQVFTCPKCGHEKSREADVKGDFNR
jgi:hypothetical protein